MAVMEVSLPSGFTVDRDSLPSLEISSHVKRVETRDGDTMVVLYFDKVEYTLQINQCMTTDYRNLLQLFLQKSDFKECD